MSDTDTDKMANARSQAMAQYASIVEMVSALRAADDDEAYEAMAQELATTAGYAVYSDDNGHYYAKVGLAYENDPDYRYSDEDSAWLACCDYEGLRPDADEARRAIEEDALSVEVRSDWQTVGETLAATEFRILLCTGGPAVQIRGELDEYLQPSRAWLECQDWGTPWTQVFDVEQDTLLAYAQCFYFGE